VQLAWRRAKAGSRPGQRTDNAKLGLVVEGGGMRGVISAGSLMMLYELGLRWVQGSGRIAGRPACAVGPEVH
jgi:hypothetical protein